MESHTGWLKAYLIILWLPDAFSFSVFPVGAGTVVLKSGVMYAEHFCVVALIHYAREVHTHPLASYFRLRSSTALRLLSGEYRCFVLLYYVKDIYVGDPFCPLILIVDPKKTCIYHYR